LMLDFYRSIGTYAFNLGIFFQNTGKERGFRVFCSLIARINPNQSSASDSSAMERLHLEPVILTSPEDLASRFHAFSS